MATGTSSLLVLSWAGAFALCVASEASAQTMAVQLQGQRLGTFGIGPLVRRRIELGPGVSVEEHRGWCDEAGCRYAWEGHGLSFGALGGELSGANVFAFESGGRIFAGVSSGVLYTDDRGEHWQRARWDSSSGPLAMSFDAQGGMAAAVGDNGNVWTSTNRGVTWRQRRDAIGRRMVAVSVLGRALVFGDSGGGVWLSLDGGTSVRTLLEPSVPRAGLIPDVSVHDNAIWVATRDGNWFRIDREGELLRVNSEGRVR